MSATTHILQQLQLLQRLLEKDEEKDEVVEVAVLKLVSYELGKLKERLHRLQEKLGAFEQKYNLKTEDFYEKFRTGALGDEMDFFEWSAIADVYKEIFQQVAEAEQMSHASPHSGAAQLAEGSRPFSSRCPSDRHPWRRGLGNQGISENSVDPGKSRNGGNFCVPYGTR